MTEPHRDLIYDVGLFDGVHTAYYLFQGYRVVAIDANPLMVERARLRFAREIEARRLTLLNVGISETPGVATFWTSGVPQWSSFDLAIASRDAASTTPVPVPVGTFSQILSEHGAPRYLKVDIEGNDRLCANGLWGAPIPKYISVETESARRAAVLDDDQGAAMLSFAARRRLSAIQTDEPVLVDSSPAQPLCRVRQAPRRQLRQGPLAREKRSLLSTNPPPHLFWCDWRAT